MVWVVPGQRGDVNGSPESKKQKSVPSKGGEEGCIKTGASKEKGKTRTPDSTPPMLRTWDFKLRKLDLASRPAGFNRME